MLESLPTVELSRVLETSCDGFWVWDVVQDEVKWSQSTFRFLGLGDQADRSYLDMSGIIHPEDRERHDDAVKACLDGVEERFGAEVRLRHADGGWLWVESRGLVLRDESRQPAKMLGFIMSRTEERRRLARAEASERRLREVMDHCPAGLMIKDAAHRHVYVNPALGALLGVEPDQLLGKTAREVVGEEGGDALAEVDARILLEGAPQQSEHHLRSRDGQLHHVLDLKFPIPGAHPDERYLGGFVVDLTDRDRREKQLRDLQSRIETMHRLESLGVLAGGIAHDFNNLLVGILGSADLARSLLPPDGEAQDAMDTIVESSRRAAQLCEKLMTYAGGTRADVQPTACPDLVHHLASLFGTREQDFSLKVSDGLPAVRADRIQLRQVLSNLVLNAREATPEGGHVFVEVSLEPANSARQANFDWTDGQAAHVVRFSVQDDGEGMDREQLRRIFDPFFSTKPGGHGLGLASVLGILRQHEGALSVTSAVGTGTVFDVYLPVARVAPSSLSGVRVSEDAARVLVVDDEATVRRVLCRMLGRLRLSGHPAEDGQQALELVQAERPGTFSAVILDLNMPGLTGLQVLERLRSLRPHLPVIISTGLDDGAASGIEAPRLRKPYGFDDLRAALEAVSVSLP